MAKCKALTGSAVKGLNINRQLIKSCYNHPKLSPKLHMMQACDSG